jgi:hypothetical protein
LRRPLNGSTLSGLERLRHSHVLVSVPQATMTRELAEAAHEAVNGVWWTGLLIYVALCVVMFGLAPLGWRWCYGRRRPQDRGV